MKHQQQALVPVILLQQLLQLLLLTAVGVAPPPARLPPPLSAVAVEPFSFRIRGTTGAPSAAAAFHFIVNEAGIKLPGVADGEWSSWTAFTANHIKNAAASATNTRQPASLGRLILHLRVVRATPPAFTTAKIELEFTRGNASHGP